MDFRISQGNVATYSAILTGNKCCLLFQSLIKSSGNIIKNDIVDGLETLDDRWKSLQVLWTVSFSASQKYSTCNYKLSNVICEQ